MRGLRSAKLSSLNSEQSLARRWDTAAGLTTTAASSFPTHPQRARSLEERLGVGGQPGFGPVQHLNKLLQLYLDR